LMDDAARAQVEALIRAEIPAQVKIVTATEGRLPLSLLLGQHLAAETTIDDRESHHDHEEDHDHDDFDSCVIELGAVQREPLLAALEQLVAAHTIYRVKGFVDLPGKPMRLLVQGVGQRFDHYFDRRWREGEARATRLVFIGEDLDEAALRQGLQAALA
ncbi:MAG: cobalamin biosynthesis protein CobW, partial [Comamonadaceae bacterium]